jgi:hypothetical protein
VLPGAACPVPVQSALALAAHGRTRLDSIALAGVLCSTDAMRVFWHQASQYRIVILRGRCTGLCGVQAEMARFSGMQYCKTDLIATKGIVFVKYTKSSSACLAMETVQESGMVRTADCCCCPTHSCRR